MEWLALSVKGGDHHSDWIQVGPLFAGILINHLPVILDGGESGVKGLIYKWILLLNFKFDSIRLRQMKKVTNLNPEANP